MGTSYICNIVVAVFTLSAISYLGRGDNPEKDGIAKLYLILRCERVWVWLECLLCMSILAPVRPRLIDQWCCPMQCSAVAIASLMFTFKYAPETKHSVDDADGSDEHYGLLSEENDEERAATRREVTEL